MSRRKYNLILATRMGETTWRMRYLSYTVKISEVVRWQEKRHSKETIQSEKDTGRGKIRDSFGRSKQFKWWQTCVVIVRSNVVMAGGECAQWASEPWRARLAVFSGQWGAVNSLQITAVWLRLYHWAKSLTAISCPYLIPKSWVRQVLCFHL